MTEAFLQSIRCFVISQVVFLNKLSDSQLLGVLGSCTEGVMKRVVEECIPCSCDIETIIPRYWHMSSWLSTYDKESSLKEIDIVLVQEETANYNSHENEYSGDRDQQYHILTHTALQQTQRKHNSFWVTY